MIELLDLCVELGYDRRGATASLKGTSVAEFLSSPYSLVIIGLVVLAFAIILLMIWIVIIDRRTRGVVDGLETERRKLAEMQRIVAHRQAPRPGYAPARPAAAQTPAPNVQPQAARPARSQQAAQPDAQLVQQPQQPGRGQRQAVSAQQPVRAQAVSAQQPTRASSASSRARAQQPAAEQDAAKQAAPWASSAQQPKAQVQAQAEAARKPASGMKARRQATQPIQGQDVRASRPSRPGSTQASSSQPAAGSARAVAARGSATAVGQSSRSRASVSTKGYTQVPNQAAAPSSKEGTSAARPRQEQVASRANAKPVAAQPMANQPAANQTAPEDRPRGRHAAR